MKNILVVRGMHKDNGHVKKIIDATKSKPVIMSKRKVAKVIMDDILPKILHKFTYLFIDRTIDTIESVFGNTIFAKYLYSIIENHIDLHNDEINNTLFVIYDSSVVDELYFKKKHDGNVVSISPNNDSDFKIIDNLNGEVIKVIASEIKKKQVV